MGHLRYGRITRTCSRRLGRRMVAWTPRISTCRIFVLVSRSEPERSLPWLTAMECRRRLVPRGTLTAFQVRQTPLLIRRQRVVARTWLHRVRTMVTHTVATRDRTDATPYRSFQSTTSSRSRGMGDSARSGPGYQVF